MELGSEIDRFFTRMLCLKIKTVEKRFKNKKESKNQKNSKRLIN